jgi:hypothetical protein
MSERMLSILFSIGSVGLRNGYLYCWANPDEAQAVPIKININ